MGEFCLYKLVCTSDQNLSTVFCNDATGNRAGDHVSQQARRKIHKRGIFSIKNKAALSTFIKLTLRGERKPKSHPHTGKGPQTVPLLLDFSLLCPQTTSASTI